MKQQHSYTGAFRDAAVFDPKQKTAISVRDGVLEYYGSELGMQPSDKLFTVYRSPATIANAAMRMAGIPITNDHVPLDMPAPSDGGFVDAAEMVDAHDPTTSTTIAIRNRLTVSDTLSAMVEAGKRELSLGYNADLVPHDDYDFEQVDIRPHHLATVDRGRCGPLCSFLDRKTDNQGDPPMKFHKAFCDAEGGLNLQQIVELAAALPEAIKAVPVDQLPQLVEPLQAVIEASKGVVPEDEPKPEPAPADSDPKPEEPEMTDEEKEKQFSDAVAKAADERAKEFADQAVKRHAEVMEKARDFLPQDYAFADKSTDQIMRDVLATEYGDREFTDNERSLAFKMLKKPEANYRDFGDRNPNDFAALADEDIGG